MEHFLGVGALEDIDIWIAGNSKDPELLSILRGPQREKSKSFVRFALEERAFQPIGPEGATLAMEIVLGEARRVLTADAAVASLGDLVGRVDQLFLTSEHYPPLVSDFWNALDWYDEEWTLENQPDLRAVLEALVTRQDG